MRPHARLLLDARGVSKRYDRVEALKGVDLTARSGEVHGLLGPNGAGKTTLLRVLLGLVKPDAGRVQLLGADQDAGRPLPDAVAGFVETPAFYPYLSGRANLALLDRLDGQGRRDRAHRVTAVLERTGLGSHAEAAVGGYSAGLRQRLGLASALLRRPRLLLLDAHQRARCGRRPRRGRWCGTAATWCRRLQQHDLDRWSRSAARSRSRSRARFSPVRSTNYGHRPDNAHSSGPLTTRARCKATAGACVSHREDSLLVK